VPPCDRCPCPCRLLLTTEPDGATVSAGAAAALVVLAVVVAAAVGFSTRARFVAPSTTVCCSLGSSILRLEPTAAPAPRTQCQQVAFTQRVVLYYSRIAVHAQEQSLTSLAGTTATAAATRFPGAGGGDVQQSWIDGRCVTECAQGLRVVGGYHVHPQGQRQQYLQQKNPVMMILRQSYFQQ
jgi:hypothetical protein